MQSGFSKEPSPCSQQDFTANNCSDGIDNIRRYGLTIHSKLFNKNYIDIVKEQLIKQAAWERNLGLSCYAYDSSPDSQSDNFLRPIIGRPTSIPGLQRIFFLVNKGRCFIDIAMNNDIQTYCHAIFGELNYSICTQYGMIIQNGVPSQPLHRAQHKLPFSVSRPLTLMVMISLTDQDEAMGSTHVIPGSHTISDANTDYSPGTERPLPLSLSAGDVLIMDGRLRHGRGSSTSNQPRINVALMYAADFLKPADCFPALITDAVYQKMSEEELKMYDFDSSYGNRFSPRHNGDKRSNLSSPLPFIPEMPQ